MKCHTGDQVELKDGRKGSILWRKGTIIEIGIYHQPNSEMTNTNNVVKVLFTKEQLRIKEKEKFSKNWNAIVNG